MTDLATRRVGVAAATEPEIGASATVNLVVRESDCASALKLSDDPRDNFPAVFATTRMIALMELAGARLLHPCSSVAKCRWAHMSMSAIPLRRRLARKSRRA